jgi:hypothetical protein
MDIASVNWLAVIVSFVAAFALGWLWYGFLFQKPWAEGLGISPPDKMPVVAMAAQIAGTFLLAWILGIAAAGNAYATAVLVVLMVASLIAASGLYAQKPGNVIVIEAGYVLAMGVVILLVQAIF